MLATILLTTLTASSAGPAVFVPPTCQADDVKPVPAAAGRPLDYERFRAGLRHGDGLLCVNRPVPSRYYQMYQPTPAEVERYGLEDGVWHCFVDRKTGAYQMERFTDAGDKPETAAKTTRAAVCDCAAAGGVCPCTGGECNGAGCPSKTTTKSAKTEPKVASQAVVVPPGHHAHTRTDGSVYIHGDENQGNAAAHQNTAWPWPKTATAGQTVYTKQPTTEVQPTYQLTYPSVTYSSCPSGRCPNAAPTYYRSR